MMMNKAKMDPEMKGRDMSAVHPGKKPAGHMHPGMMANMGAHINAGRMPTDKKTHIQWHSGKGEK